MLKLYIGEGIQLSSKFLINKLMLPKMNVGLFINSRSMDDDEFKFAYVRSQIDWFSP